MKMSDTDLVEQLPGLVEQLPDLVEQAAKRIEGHIQKTNLEYSYCLSQESAGSQVYIKWENEQVTGSFKARGAFSKVLHLNETDPELRETGIVAASSGNHALACIAAGKQVGCPVKLFCVENLDKSKLDRLLLYGADVTQTGRDCLDGELAARKYAKEGGRHYVSPYNDTLVMAGQGTIGYEILTDLSDVDVVLASVGGGGLIGGIAGFLKKRAPLCKIVGCTPRNSKVMYECVKAGKILFEESSDTLSSGTAGGVEENSVTFEVCRWLIDDWILVDEDEIARAIYYVLDKHKKVVEGAAGVAFGAFIKCADKFKGKKVVIISCGNNIGCQTLKTILNEYCS